MKNAVINISICLSDIPTDKIKVGKNGKKYLNVTIAGRKEPDQYENNVTVYTSQSKEEREAKAEKSYIGAGRHIEFTGGENSTGAVDNMPAYDPNNDEDGLPF